MARWSYKKGHKIYYNEEKQEWFYSDDDSPVSVERPCKRCGHMPLENGEDYCLGHLPNVKAACCGHGAEEGYIMLENGQSFREEFWLTERFISKVEYEKGDNTHEIWIREYYYGEMVSEVSIKGQNKDFESNLESMEKICKLENELRKSEDELSKIKLILKDSILEEFEDEKRHR